jgi:hypothetical protein
VTTKKHVKPKLIPPDTKRCQAEYRAGSFMTLGPRPMVRCDKRPSHIITEKEPNPADGECGSMSVCPECLAMALKHFGTGLITVKAI